MATYLRWLALVVAPATQIIIAFIASETVPSVCLPKTGASRQAASLPPRIARPAVVILVRRLEGMAVCATHGPSSCLLQILKRQHGGFV